MTRSVVTVRMTHSDQMILTGLAPMLEEGMDSVAGRAIDLGVRSLLEEPETAEEIMWLAEATLRERALPQTDTVMLLTHLCLLRGRDDEAWLSLGFYRGLRLLYTPEELREMMEKRRADIQSRADEAREQLRRLGDA